MNLNDENQVMSQKQTIDINCDLGEGETAQDCEKDAQLMSYLSSCNIACGGHAGNNQTIALSIDNAVQHKLKIGAHPGYADKSHFGRVSIALSNEKLILMLKEQLTLFSEIAQQKAINLHHIKLHGALYNDVESNSEKATLVASFFKQQYADTAIYGLAGGELEKACRRLNLKFIAEGFIDRRYLANGKLTPRSQQGAVITDINQSIEQALALAKGKAITTIDGQSVTPQVKTLCLHGDNQHALEVAENLHRTLVANNVEIQ